MAITRLILVIMIAVGASYEVAAQGRYSVSVAPDAWYHTIDGARLGIRLRGQMAGTFGDGPHRLDTGIWLGSKLPKDPVSYYVSLTEPIPAFSDFGSEASVEGYSSIRDGHHMHGFVASKRWQRGFNEREFSHIRISGNYAQRYDTRYALIPGLWQSRPVYTVEPVFQVRKSTEWLGDISQTAHLTIGSYKRPDTDAFYQLELDHQSRKPLGSGFVLGHRLFLGFSSTSTPIERRYRLSSGKANDDLVSGITRSRGILPQSGIDDGWVHTADGPNLRGYGRFEMKQAPDGIPITYASVGALNLEMDFANPVTWLLSRVPVLGGVLNSRMYAFSDHGTAFDSDAYDMVSNAGLGFSVGLNIPDYLGRSRTLSLRYDVPAWISDPGPDSSPWKYRSVFGIWSVINI